MTRHTDLAAAVVLAFVGAVAALAIPWIPLRGLLGVPLVMVLPGYALSCALFPGALGWTERLLLTGGIGLAAIVLGALVLNSTPWGLSTGSWAVALFCLTAVGAAVAAYRRDRREWPDSTQAQRAPLEPRQLGLLAAAALITGTALWLAHTPIPEQSVQGYTLLWAVPDREAGDTHIRVGVQSYEPGATRYTLRIASDGQSLQEFTFDLQPIDEWQGEVTVSPGSAHQVEALLYRADAPEVVYRRTVVRVGT